MTDKKPTNAEEEYFAREEIEKRYKLAKELAGRRAEAEAEALKAAHHMHCPKCGNTLQTITFRDVEVDRCFYCHGTWLDAGELERLAGKEQSHGILRAVVDAFRPGQD
jgi:hypothetical protein